jgi:hypothetical protein
MNEECKVKKTVIIGVLLTILLVSTAVAFDGHRKGFVLGGGLGFAPIVKWEMEESPEDGVPYGHDETRAGVGLNLLIGYAWDDKNMIVYEGNAAGFTTAVSDKSAAQGFSGAAWYHYFGPAGKTAFTVVGLGLYSYDAEYDDPHDGGFGMLLGGGYEFARHWQVGGYLSFGSTTAHDRDYNHATLNVLVSGILF